MKNATTFKRYIKLLVALIISTLCVDNNLLNSFSSFKFSSSERVIVNKSYKNGNEDDEIATIANSEITSYYDPTDNKLKSQNATIVENGTTELNSGWYVVNGTIDVNERLIITGDVTIILADGAQLNANQGISVISGNNLTIYGQSSDYINNGKIIAVGYDGWAGIGCGTQNNTGLITINGGNIKASGAYADGAGIGGGQGNPGGDGYVTINGGYIVAEGSYLASGIGGGNGGNGEVKITGGIINASGGIWSGSGIGGGCDGNGTVTITGGDVTATGMDFGAGIGGGQGGAGNVTITGGRVTARGGDRALADIGDGNGEDKHPTVPGKFSTGSNGNAIIDGTILDKSNQKDWKGIVDGTVYGDYVLDRDYTLDGDLTIPEGSSLTVPRDVTFTNNGNITNNGTFTNNGDFNNNKKFVNDGTINNNGTFNNGGTLENNKLLDNKGRMSNNGNIENNGTFNNENNFTNDGTLLNKEQGNVKNEGIFENREIVTNDGKFDNNGELRNEPHSQFRNNNELVNDGQLTNDGNIENSSRGNIQNNDLLHNDGNITNDGDIQNNGTFSNARDANLKNNNNFFNERELENNGQITNEGTLLNNGNINNSGNGDIQNNSVFENNEKVTNDGNITNNGSLNNHTNAEIDNNNNFTNKNDFKNDGKFTNDGTFTNEGNTHNSSNGNIQNNDTLNNNGIITNDGTLSNSNNGNIQNNDTLTNNKDLVNDGKIENNGTLENNENGNIQNNNTLTNSKDVTNSGKITNEGLIENKEGSTFENSEKGVIENNKDFVNDPLADYQNNGTVTNKKYSVVFIAYNDLKVAEMSVAYGDLIKLPNYTRKGYTLIGWYLDRDFTEEWNFESDAMPSHEIILYAKWQINKYKVSFKSIDKVELPKDVIQEYNTVLKLPKVPEKLGYTGKWVVDGKTVTEIKVTGDITVNLVYIVNSYTIKFISDEEVISKSNVNYGAKIKEPNISKEGYELEGWYLERDFINRWNFSEDTVGLGNINLYAKWIKKEGVFEEDIESSGKLNAQFSMTEDEIADAVLQEEDRKLLEKGKNIKILLDITDAKVSSEDKKLISKNLKDYEIYKYYDIELLKIFDDNKENILTTIKPLKITIDIPSELQKKDREFVILRLHDGEVSTLEDLDNNSKTYTFESDKFSIYALAYKDKEKQEKSEFNYLWLLLLLLIVGIITIAIIIYKKRKNEEN